LGERLVTGYGGFDVVSLLYKIKKEASEERKRDGNVFWVTDLVRCPLKREYEMIYPEISLSSIFSPSAIIGDLIHIGIEEVIRNRAGLGAVLTEVEGSKGVMLPDGREVEVRGRCDIILEIEGDRIGVEIKSARSDAKIPLEHHIDQVRLYNWLFNLRKSYLVYITHERITQYPVEQRATDDEVVTRITSRSYPRYIWECRYCSYAVLCPYKKY
jgi:CRISPR-associated exonuclease Cas4